MTAAACEWCLGPMPAGCRRDAKFCRKACRQASHRFGRERPRNLSRGAGAPLRLGYADPPYPGTARRYYLTHRDYGGEVDHCALVLRLYEEFPDGWALSTSSRSLQELLSYCKPGVRVAGWFRGERPTASYSPLQAWEPVLYFGGRAVRSEISERRLDALVAYSRPRLTDPARVVGAKPARFCWWLFGLLGARPGDEFVDLFPGSGGVARAWSVFCRDVDARRVVEDLRDVSA